MGKRTRVLIALGMAYFLTIALPASVRGQDCNPQKASKIVQEAINKTDSLVLPKGEVKIVAPLHAGLGDGDNFRRITEQQAEALQRLAGSGAIVVRVLQAPRTSPGPVDLSRMMSTAISGTIGSIDVSPAGFRTEQGYREEPDRFYVRGGTSTVGKIAKAEPIVSAGHSLCLVYYTYRYTASAPIQRFLSEFYNNGASLSEDRKARILLKHDPFSSGWNAVIWDVANASDPDFTSDNVGRALIAIASGAPLVAPAASPRVEQSAGQHKQPQASLHQLTIGIPLQTANDLARQRCHNLSKDGRMDNGMWCAIPGSQESPPKEHWQLYWAANSQGVIYSILENYFIPSSDHASDCKKILEAFKSSNRDAKLVAYGGDQTSDEQDGKKVTRTWQNFGFEGQPPYRDTTSEAPGFSFRCENIAHADIWPDKILVSVGLSDSRLLTPTSSPRAPSPPRSPAPKPAAATNFPLQASDLPSLFPGLRIDPSSKRAGWRTIRTFREPELQIGTNTFKLTMNWNGVDEEKWPFSKILQSLTTRACGAVGANWATDVMDRLYRSQSLTPARTLEGTGGQTFSKRIVETAGRCRAELNAAGARWHDLNVTVSLDSDDRVTRTQPTSLSTAPASDAKPKLPTVASQPETTTYSEPEAYCRAIGTADEPSTDKRFNGDSIAPSWMVSAFFSASQISAQQAAGQRPELNITWRCLNGQVLACASTNSPLCVKFSLDRTPTTSMLDWCQRNPNQAIPLASTGRKTAFNWSCKDKVPAITRLALQPDERGYPIEYWKRVSSAAAGPAPSSPVPKDDLGVCGSAHHQRAVIADTFCIHSDGRMRSYAGCDKDLTAPEQGLMSPVMAESLRSDLARDPPAVVRFVKACKQHDDCYGTKGTRKSACDTQFYIAMTDACRRDMPSGFSELGKKACFENALRFNDAVRKMGCEPFKSAQQSKGVPEPVCE